MSAAPVTCQDYLGTLRVLRFIKTWISTIQHVINYATLDLYALYSRCSASDYFNDGRYTHRDRFGFMIGLDKEPVYERPWLRDTAKKRLSMLSKDELLEIYEKFRNVIAEKHFKKNFHLYARQWMKEVMQFIGHMTSIPDDALVTRMDTDNTVYYGSSMCAACGKQMAID